MRDMEQVVAEQATGCGGAGDYRKWAAQQGYPFCEVWDWTSSAGDWTFIVSVDGTQWFPMFQTNRYPRGPGFDREVDESRPIDGTKEDAFDYLALLCS